MTSPDLTGNQTVRLLHELKERRLAQYSTAYAAGGWVVLEVLDQLIGNEILPGFLYSLALVLFLTCIPGVFIIAWFHGARGDQVAPRFERGLLALVGVIALVAGGFTVRRGLADDAPSIAALDALAPTEDPRRIAVLYFEGRGDGESGTLAMGLTESLIDRLASVDALHVVSRNGVRRFRETAVSQDSIGRALQVGVLVEGLVTQGDSLVRVEVELIQARTGEQLGENVRLERPRSEIFALQDDLAEEISVALRTRIGEEVALIERKPGTRDPEAWLRVQAADELEVEHQELADLGDLEAARQRLLRADSLLAEAERIDPTWAEPTTMRGWLAYRRSRLLGFERSEENSRILDRAVEYANLALARAGSRDSASALELRATAQYWRHLLNLTSTAGETEELFRRAEEDFRAAIRLEPSRASALNSFTHLLLRKGDVAEANLTARKAYTADPYLRTANRNLWYAFSGALELQDRVEAQKWCSEGLKRFADDYRFRECQIWTWALPGSTPDIDRAWELCDEWVERAPEETREFQTHRCHMVVGMALVRAGLPDSARAVVTRARAGPDIDPVRELAQLEAIVRAWVGDVDEAFRHLAQFNAANPDVDGDATDEEAEESWWLQNLRDDPRYRSIVQGN